MKISDETRRAFFRYALLSDGVQLLQDVRSGFMMASEMEAASMIHTGKLVPIVAEARTHLVNSIIRGIEDGFDAVRLEFSSDGTVLRTETERLEVYAKKELQ